MRPVNWTIVHGGCRWVRADEQSPGDASPYWSLWWVDRPIPFTLDGQDRTWSADPGTLVLTPPRHGLHRFLPQPIVLFYLSLRLDPPCRSREPYLHPVGEAESRLLRRLIAVQIGRAAPQAPEMVATTALIGLVLAGLGDLAWQAEAADARIQEALKTLRQDARRHLGIAELAAAAGLSQGRFLRLFRAQTGTSPQRLRLDWRLDQAADALRNGAGIKEAARAAGWSERTRFSTAFRQRFGLPPARWLRAQGQ